MTFGELKIEKGVPSKNIKTEVLEEVLSEVKERKEITLESIKEALPLEKEVGYYLKTSFLYEKGLKNPEWIIRQGAARSLGALAPVNTELFISLYEKGIKDPEWVIRQNTAKSLGALAPVSPEVFTSLCEKGLKDPDRDVRQGIAESLGAMAPVNTKLFTSLYEKGIKDPEIIIRQNTAKSIGALAPVNTELFISLYEKGIKDSDSVIRQSTAKSLKALAPVNPELFISLYEKGMKTSDSVIHQGLAESLGILAPVNPELFTSLYEKGLKDSDVFVRQSTAKSLGALAPVNPELFISLYEKGIKDSNVVVCQGTAKSLEALAPVNPELFISLYEEGIKDPEIIIRQGIAESLGALAPVNPELFTSLYEKGIKDSDVAIRQSLAKSLGALAPVNPELFTSLYEKGLKDSDVFIRQSTAKSLKALAPVNTELFISLYEKSIKDPDSVIRQSTAESLEALAKAIKITKKEVINQENLNSLIKNYGLSSRREDIDFFRTVVSSFKKELSPFLKNKELPKSLKYQIKIGLIESLEKEIMMSYFQQAVTDFNLSSKKESYEAKRERRIILEFLSLLPTSDFSHYLVTQAEKIIPHLGDLNSMEMRTFKALADTNSRAGNRLLLKIISKPGLALQRREYILRKLVQNKVLEKDLLTFLGKERKEKESFFRILEGFKKELPKSIFSASLFDLHLNQGMSFSEIRKKKEEFERKDISFSELVPKLAKDKNLAALYFTFYPSSFRYDNILSFENFFEFLKSAENLEEDNQGLKDSLRALWQKKGKSSEEVDQFLELIQKGIPIYEEVIRGKEEEEKEKIKDISLETIGNLTRNFANLEPIFALSGRLQGLLGKEEEKLKEMQKKIAEAADYLDTASNTVFQKENLEPLYQKLYFEYQNFLKEKGEKKILTLEELYQEDKNKFLNLLQKEEFFNSELLLNHQKSLKETSNFISETIISRLEKYSKKQSRPSEKLQVFIEDIKEEIKTCLENLKLKIETKPLRLTFKQVCKFDFKEEKHLVEFIRIGDARESCIATNGSSSWSISHYLQDFGTVGFLILDQDKAVGHIISHLGKDNQNNPILLVNGIYCKGNYPSQAISQRAVIYLEDFAQKTGLSEVLLAKNFYADVVPPQYQEAFRIVQRLQGVKSRLYSNFNASIDYLDFVTCYQRAKR